MNSQVSVFDNTGWSSETLPFTTTEQVGFTLVNPIGIHIVQLVEPLNHLDFTSNL